MIIRVARLPRPGETLLGGEFLTAAGGKGANQAVGAARAGGRVQFIARVGRDDLGDAAVAALMRDHIDVSSVSRDPAAASGVALIFVAKNGENSIAVAGGANATLTPAHVRRAATLIRSAAVLVAQLETPPAAVRAATANAGVPVILNPAPAPARPLSSALLRQVTYITPNESEAELLTGIKVADVAGAAQAAAKLRSRGVGTVIITLGVRGAYVAGNHVGELVPGFKVKAVDTTAAGDVFNGALAVALAEGRPILDAVRFANAAAAVSVTRRGAQPSAPLRVEIDRLLASG